MELIASKPSASQTSLIHIGRIIGLHGLRGALRYRPDYPESESIGAVERIFLADGDEGIDARESDHRERAAYARNRALDAG